MHIPHTPIPVYDNYRVAYFIVTVYVMSYFFAVGTSPVVGFESQALEFVDNMHNLGVKIKKVVIVDDDVETPKTRRNTFVTTASTPNRLSPRSRSVTVDSSHLNAFKDDSSFSASSAAREPSFSPRENVHQTSFEKLGSEMDEIPSASPATPLSRQSTAGSSINSNVNPMLSRSVHVVDVRQDDFASLIRRPRGVPVSEWSVASVRQFYDIE